MSGRNAPEVRCSCDAVGATPVGRHEFPCSCTVRTQDPGHICWLCRHGHHSPPNRPRSTWWEMQRRDTGPKFAEWQPAEEPEQVPAFTPRPKEAAVVVEA